MTTRKTTTPKAQKKPARKKAAAKKPARQKTAPAGSKSWGGRFGESTDLDAQAFTASIGFDIRLYPYDIRVSTAHARMLAAQKIISIADSTRIVRALKQIGGELDEGSFVPSVADEDIHMAIERRLVEKIGSVGARLHAGRSRNDQVITDVRLFVKDAIAGLSDAIAGLQAGLRQVAKDNEGAIMPGYTHLQRAQPVLLGHHLLAYHDMLERDSARLADCLARVDVLPLGAGALAGSTLPLNPKLVAAELGFGQVATNSIDAVSDRDFIIEFLSATAIMFSHLGRLATEITLWASSEFGFVGLHDSFSTGSSMMPQKKNPDIAELVRGKSGRIYGNLVALLTVVKGLPLAYNSDMQEDKEALFDSADTADRSLRIMTALLQSLAFNTNAMREAASDGMLLATDLAEYLVARGLPFREAHEVTGRVVADCLERGVDLASLSSDELKAYSSVIADDITDVFDPDKSVARRKAGPGTAGSNVARRLRALDR